MPGTALLEEHAGIWSKALTFGGTLLFVAGGLTATRVLAAHVERRFTHRRFGAAGSTLRIMITAVGYSVVALTGLSLIAVPLQQLVLGGALTGVVIGIAAQQTLGNVFAGLVILVVRPFRIGDTIEVRSGALNGPFTGRVIHLGMTYVTLTVDNGTLLLPNAGVLAAGVTVGLPPTTAEGDAPLAAQPATTPEPDNGPPQTEMADASRQ
ncbi:mechanosensitive ion channel domain-containing protein [Amycolatopsis sp. H20-H5]|uniref:mechanosensitive ion channel domain-containing protein n=1 Tax=Amycolatopsis sp. H20-H5 TaxID=3046309 RepID=UPI002DB89960|nr:mechanosensitive ion channel domain-containing protein [Amycolatopsis sp. H20-H5]MEC3982001.1 mechanosensitive ion channel domain-containing protein [Amycolatopsis sp. H20-H5]